MNNILTSRYENTIIISPIIIQVNFEQKSDGKDYL